MSRQTPIFFSKVRDPLVAVWLEVSQAALIGSALSHSCQARAEFGKGHMLDLRDAAFVNA